MSKLSLDALKQRAEATASQDLLATISGGTENACHKKEDQGFRGLAVEIGKAIFYTTFGR